MRSGREGSSAELSDTRRSGSADARRSTPRGEEAVSGRRSIAARNAAKAPGAATSGAGARPRPVAARRTPKVPCAASFVAEAEHTEAARGELRRTATRRRICIRRAVAWTRKPAEQHREHGSRIQVLFSTVADSARRCEKSFVAYRDIALGLLPIHRLRSSCCPTQLIILNRHVRLQAWLSPAAK